MARLEWHVQITTDDSLKNPDVKIILEEITNRIHRLVGRYIERNTQIDSCKIDVDSGFSRGVYE